MSRKAVIPISFERAMLDHLRIIASQDPAFDGSVAAVVRQAVAVWVQVYEAKQALDRAEIDGVRDLRARIKDLERRLEEVGKPAGAGRGCGRRSSRRKGGGADATR